MKQKVAEEDMEVSGNKIRWKGKKWLYVLLLFCIISMVGSFLVPENVGGGYIIFMMMIIVVISVKKDMRWNKLWKKILWTIGVWGLQALLMIPTVLLFNFILEILGINNVSREFFRITYVIASFPILFWSMRKSKYFIYRK